MSSQDRTPLASSKSASHRSRFSIAGVLLRIVHGSPRTLAALTISILAALAIGLYTYMGGEFGRSLGSNLLSDAIILALGFFLIERILEADRDRQNASNHRLAYRACSPVYWHAHALWCGVVALACKFDASEQADLGTEPFSPQVIAKVKNVGLRLNELPGRMTLIDNISFTAERIDKTIQSEIETLGPYMDADLRRLMMRLKKSPFIIHCAYLKRGYERDSMGVLPTFGSNVVWSLSQSRDLDEKLFLRKEIVPDVILERDEEDVGEIMTKLYQNL